MEGVFAGCMVDVCGHNEAVLAGLDLIPTHFP